MKTLLVGDIHLLGKLIYPRIMEWVERLEIEQVILLGDYFDQWNQNKNSELYISELNLLKDLKLVLKSKNIKVVLLCGNHDIPYLTQIPKHYTLDNVEMMKKIGNDLLELGLRIAYNLEGIIISHAGYTSDYSVEDWHFKKLTKSHLESLKKLEEQVGSFRGGSCSTGSPVWADFRNELAQFPNRNYLKQIVGHSPMRTISQAGEIYCIDTLSLDSRLSPIGSGSFLLYDNGIISILKNSDWDTLETYEIILEHLQ